MSTTYHCPIETAPGRLCDQHAFYLVDGTALCRDHALEAGASMSTVPPEPATSSEGES